jgi:bla regulator protein blaR1
MSFFNASHLAAFVVVYSVAIAAFSAVVTLAIGILRPRAAAYRLRCWTYALSGAILFPVLFSFLPVWLDAVVGGEPSAVPSVTSGLPLLTVDATSTYTGDALGWSRVLLAVIVSGACIRLAWLGVGLLRLRRFATTAPALEPLPDALWRLQVDLQADAKWCISDDLGGPATFGSSPPTIVLPSHVLADERLLRNVACHELCHVSRDDWGMVLFQRVVGALFWFHPAIWWMSDRVTLAREQVVDEAVVSLLDDRSYYLEALVNTAARRLEREPLLAWLQKKHLKARVAALLQGGPMDKNRERLKAAVMTVVLVVAAQMGIQVFDLAAQAPAEIYTVGGDVSAPAVVRMVRPEYTKEAMNLRIAGEVVLSAVVKDDGSVGDVSVKQSLDDRYGLDDAAVAAMKQCEFAPGMRQGKPVAVRVDVSMKFALK